MAQANRGIALISFVDRVDNKTYRVEQGAEVDIPAGATWIKVGFVEPVKTTRSKATNPAATRRRKATKE